MLKGCAKTPGVILYPFNGNVYIGMYWCMALVVVKGDDVGKGIVFQVALV